MWIPIQKYIGHLSPKNMKKYLYFTYLIHIRQYQNIGFMVAMFKTLNTFFYKIGIQKWKDYFFAEQVTVKIAKEGSNVLQESDNSILGQFQE